MEVDDIISIVIPVAIIGGFSFVAYSVWKQARRVREMGLESVKRNEALFQSLFPDLQPHLHPEKLHEFVKAWRSRGPSAATHEWNNPPGFPGAAKAAFSPAPKGEQVRILDAAGALLTQFLLETHAEGGAVRVGPGKFTVNIQDAQDPRVRYWHPKREFKWSRRKGWKFVTPVADQSIDSDDRGTSFSSDRSSTSTAATTAAAAAGVAGLGGAFDGGGAAGSWEEGGAKGSESTSY
jgi:hypothetical protein